jgi:hypothetical protein
MGTCVRMDAARRIIETRVLVSRMLGEGRSRGEIAAALSLSKSTVSYHARRLGHPVDERGARRYDWTAVQAFYDDGHSVAECVVHFGFSRQTWSAAVQRGAIVTRDWVLPLDRLLVADTYRSRNNLKNRLIRAGIKQNCCEECGVSQWRGRRLSIALHHVNGDGQDNRLENLKFLCPNCHSQTENFSGRGRRRIEAA